MGPATWQQVKDLFDRAIGLPPTMQDPFVRENAAPDSSVLLETLRLLELERRPGSPIDKLAAPLQIGFDRNGGIRALIPGRTLAGRYRIIRFPAAGGRGEVYEAEDLERGERIALKTLRAPFNTPDHAARLRREVEAARQVRHANVCPVDALVQVDSLVFLSVCKGQFAGADDHFATPNDPIPYLSPRFRKLPLIARQLTFDDRSSLEGELRLSFPLPPVEFCSGVLEMRIRKMGCAT